MKMILALLLITIGTLCLINDIVYIGIMCFLAGPVLFFWFLAEISDDSEIVHSNETRIFGNQAISRRINGAPEHINAMASAVVISDVFKSAAAKHCSGDNISESIHDEFSSHAFDTIATSSYSNSEIDNDDNVINPANGNPMIGGIGGIDIEGNPYGVDNDDSQNDTFNTSDDSLFEDNTFETDAGCMDNFDSCFNDSTSSDDW